MVPRDKVLIDKCEVGYGNTSIGESGTTGGGKRSTATAVNAGGTDWSVDHLLILLL